MDEKSYNKQLADSLETVTSQSILDKYGITEYTVDDLIREFEDAYSYKVEQARIFKILDAADHSEIWKVYNRKIPKHVQTPTANPITIIKEATKASIMPTSFQGEFRALSIDAKELALVCNKYFAMKWEAANMDAVNDEAADYAFLHGTSGVLFGWNENIVDYADVSNYFNPAKHVQFQAKSWHPSNIFPDPSADTVEEMSYLFFAERKSKAFLKTIARFRDAMYAIENATDVAHPNQNVVNDISRKSSNETVTFITCYKRVNRLAQDPTTGQIRLVPKVDVIYMAGKNILDISPNIEPNIIPFVPLYDEKIPNNFWGISKCYKVLSLVLALNQLDSIEATSYFKNQNPAEFINALAGLNVAQYQNKRDNPDAAFTVNCDPKLVQAFAQRPELPKTLDGFRQYLLQEIANVSGVDAAYLGRSYGSIQTTGGVEQAVDRATMRDSNRIKMIDQFIRKEIEVMCQFYIAHGSTEKFMAQTSNPAAHDEAGKLLQFDPQALIAREDIEISVSNAAPRSNQSYENAAMSLLELQMKYDPQSHGYADFITPEEFINWMNIPKSQKHLISERMRAQQENMKLEEYTAVISAFGQLVDGGMDPQQALMEVAKQVEASKLGQLPAASGVGPQNINGQIPPAEGGNPQ